MEVCAQVCDYHEGALVIDETEHRKTKDNKG